MNFVTISNILYGVDVSGNLWDLSTTATKDDLTDITWYMISKVFNEGTPSSKIIITELLCLQHQIYHNKQNDNH